MRKNGFDFLLRILLGIAFGGSHLGNPLSDWASPRFPCGPVSEKAAKPFTFQSLCLVIIIIAVIFHHYPFHHSNYSQRCLLNIFIIAIAIIITTIIITITIIRVITIITIIKFPHHDQITSRSNSVVVEFHSDRAVTGKGFTATWRKVILMMKLIMFLIMMKFDSDGTMVMVMVIVMVSLRWLQPMHSHHLRTRWNP